MKVSQQEYNTRLERFKRAMRRQFELNVCHMVGRCAAGCIAKPGALRCPEIYATPEQLAQASREYDAAFEAHSEAEL